MAMVTRANMENPGIGGIFRLTLRTGNAVRGRIHHFLSARHAAGAIRGTLCALFSGACLAGVYARAFLEGRLTEQQFGALQAGAGEGGGLSSYPHPWLMPGISWNSQPFRWDWRRMHVDIYAGS